MPIVPADSHRARLFHAIRRHYSSPPGIALATSAAVVMPDAHSFAHEAFHLAKMASSQQLVPFSYTPRLAYFSPIT